MVLKFYIYIYIYQHVCIYIDIHTIFSVSIGIHIYIYMFFRMYTFYGTGATGQPKSKVMDFHVVVDALKCRYRH